MNGKLSAATVTVMDTFEMTSSDFVEQEESSIMRGESSEWTNEKHSLYLKSIEASFVDQLYNSLEMQSCQTQKTCSSDAISSWKNHPNAYIPSGQFKVLQGGCWSKKNFMRENSQPKDTNRPKLSPGNPWIQHFTTGCKHGDISFLSHQKRLYSTETLLQCPVPDSRLHQQSGSSNSEVTGQNFVEDTLIEKEKKQRSKKRTRTSRIAVNDQVVPFCTSAATEINDTYVLPEKK
uniref:cold-regulated protein 27-like isoform X2 n=1 Tax=Erigeron canadensis TaxID=72917 RepID=UPI001CB95428|nr:cold-regulated protein 27-like isoform X2 [Erigeron canadensis]